MNEELKKRIAAINSGIIPDGYKKTKVGIVPVEWEVVKAKEIFANISNKKHNGKLEVLSVTQDRGIIPRSEVDIDIKYDKESTGNYKKVEKGNFVISLRSFQGGIEYSEYEGIVSPAYTVLSSKVDICDSYYKSFLKSPEYIQRLNTAVYGIRDGKNISYDDFSLIYIPFPPLPEQQKIAEILSTQDKLIELQEKKIEQLKELKKAYLQKIFPKKGSQYPELRFKGFTDAWEQRKLGDISDSYSGGTPTAGKSEYYGGDIPFIRSAEVNSDSTELFLTEEGLKNSSAKMVNKGDILYALYGATSGEVGLARLNGAINQAILDIKPHANYDAQFIMQWLRKSKENIISTYLQGGQGNLSGTIVTSLMVDCPTYSEQQKIGDYFRNLDHLIILHQRKLEQEKQKKKALMQLLLTGKVRVKP